MSWIKTTTIKKLPCSTGLYAIYSLADNKLLYIGASSNIYRRFFNAGPGYCGFSKIRQAIPTDKLYFKYKITNDLWMENILIFRLKPPFNRRGAIGGRKYAYKRNIWQNRKFDLF